jgi:hypothetical protein
MRTVDTLDRLLASLRHRCLSLPDQRSGANTQYDMADFGIAVFSVFFMQGPSFLEHQRHVAKERGRSNCEALFAMTKIPGDSQIRAKLDPIEPFRFHPMFDDVLDELQRSGGIGAFRRLGNHVLIALDGTQYHSSCKVHCDNCSTRRHGNGKTEFHHGLLAATLVAPGHNRVVPLIPEFIVPRTGTTNRIAKAAPFINGWPRTAHVMLHSIRSCWGMICSPVARFARRYRRRARISCLSANPPRIPRSRNFPRTLSLMNCRKRSNAGGNGSPIVTSG